MILNNFCKKNMQNYKKFTKIDLSERKYLALESWFVTLSVICLLLIYYSVMRVSVPDSTHSCSKVLLVSDVLERRGCFSCKSLCLKNFLFAHIDTDMPPQIPVSAHRTPMLHMWQWISELNVHRQPMWQKRWFAILDPMVICDSGYAPPPPFEPSYCVLIGQIQN